MFPFQYILDSGHTQNESRRNKTEQWTTNSIVDEQALKLEISGTRDPPVK